MSEVNQKDTYVRFFGQSNKKAKQQAKEKLNKSKKS
jgi:hypothetical protein